ncbi:MAG: flagella basal body P-ring formation protein FlgA, partial [Dehalococcoidia bacterium]
MNRQRYKYLLVASLTLTVATTGPRASARADQIRIWPAAVVTGDAVTLADVADLRGFDTSTSQRLGRIVVHAAPRAGGEVLVRIADIRGALSEADANLAAIQVFGSARCKVSKPRAPRQARPPAKDAPQRRGRPRPVERTNTIRAESRPNTLESLIRQHIAARVPDGDAKLEIRFSPASESALRLGTDEYRFKIRPAGGPRLGFVSFEVDIARRDDQSTRTESILAEVQLVQAVIVARRAINRGKTIEGRDLKLEARRFSDVQSVGITDLSAVVGRRCGRFLQEGDMLRAEALRTDPLVRRG